VSALGLGCALVGSWLIVAALGATVPARFKRIAHAADPGEQYTPLEALDEFTVAQLELPPVPEPRSWIDKVTERDLPLIMAGPVPDFIPDWMTS
jgi:hypothetical protein